MVVTYVWLGVIFALLVAGFVVMMVDAIKNAQTREMPNATGITWVAALLITIGGPLVFEFPYPGRTVMRLDGDQIQACPDGAWDLEFLDDTIVNVPRSQKTSGHERIVTENPKVRDLTYDVDLECVDPVLFLKGHPERITLANTSKRGLEMQKLAEFQFYEFNNAHSKKLAAFYNPLDDSQQERFSELLCTGINDQLAKDGLKAVKARFRIN